MNYYLILIKLVFFGFILPGSVFADAGEPAQSSSHFATYHVEELADGEFMHDFLLIGPFPNPIAEGFEECFHTSECIGFFTDYLQSAGGETGITPEQGDTVFFGEGEYRIWQQFHSNIFKIDFQQVFKSTQFVVAYAACWLECKRDRKKLFGLGTNDGVNVWLNGENIFTHHRPSSIEIDDDYLLLPLKKGGNLLLLKIDNGEGRWGFALRPMNQTLAWEHIQKDLDREFIIEFQRKDNDIVGSIGDPNTLRVFDDLPQVQVIFSSLLSNHEYRLTTAPGKELIVPLSVFPDEEYAIKATLPLASGDFVVEGYLHTGDVIEEVRQLFQKDLPPLPPHRLAEYYQDIIENLRWMDKANRLFNHPYGYRRYRDGLLRIRQNAGRLQSSTNPYDGLFPPPREIQLLKGRVSITPQWRIFDVNRNEDFIESEIARIWHEKFSTPPQYTATPAKQTIRLIQSDAPDIPSQSGGYILHARPTAIEIRSRSRQGLFYGLDTFLQLLQQATVIPAAVVRDWPQFDYRASYEPTSELTDEYKVLIDRLARLRYNMVYIPSGKYLHLEELQNLADMQQVFDYCKSRFIEPIPYAATFDGGTLTRALNPCLDEGIFYEKEEWIVPDDGLINLPVPRILDCENTTLHAFLPNGTDLQRGEDFEIVSTKPPQIRVLNKSLKGKTILLSYDAVDFSRFKFAASCPSDPLAWEIEDQVIGKILTHFKPKYFHIGQDETGFVNKCSRCKARGLTNKEIMIDEINRVYEIVRKYSPDVEIHMWGDQFNDYQNAILLDARGSGEGVPKDIVQLDWRYVAVTHYDKRMVYKQMRYFFDLGLRVMGASWYEPMNVMDLLMSGERAPELFLGLVHTSWGDYRGSLLPIAEAGWTGSTFMGRIEF